MNICCFNPSYKTQLFENKYEVTVKMTLCPKCLELYIQYFGNSILNNVLENLEDKNEDNNR